ncbi:MAG TPA: hypothetical protein VGP92_03345 [Acidimicrobiia bacterium]|jgi:hypothetical protein|nr:hypothetical protein [Acidimicrobiia bacterium]
MREPDITDEPESRIVPKAEPDFFDRIFDEASDSLRDGKRFAPDAIEMTFAEPSTAR